MDVKKQILINRGAIKTKRQIISLRPMRIDGCIRYRIDMPLKMLSAVSNDYNFILAPDVQIDQLYFSDMLFCLQPHKTGIGEYTLPQIAKMHNFKIAIDYNDDVFNIPVSNPASLDDESRKNAEDMIREADSISATTTFMRDSIKKWNSNIAVIPNYFDMYNYLDLFVPVEAVRLRNKESGRVVVGYVGSANHTEDQQPFLDAVVRIMRRNKNVDVACFGFWPEKLLLEFGSRVKHAKFCGLHAYHHVFKNLGIDILVNPLIENNFNKCKSNIKWLEGTFHGAVVVASPIPSFADLGPEHCRIVPWAEHYDEWVTNFEVTIENLIHSPEERYAMLAASQEWMAGAWDISVGWRAWDDYFRRAMAGESVEGLDYTPRNGRQNALLDSTPVYIPGDWITDGTTCSVAGQCAGDSAGDVARVDSAGCCN